MNIVESKNIFLGKKSYDNENDTPNVDNGEPLVLGQTLVSILEDMVDAIGKIFVGGTIGGTSIPIELSGSPGWQTLLQTIKPKIKEIESYYHFIEKNDTAEK